MMWIIITLAAVIMLLLALVFAGVLGWANEALAVAVDPKIESIGKILPGANCGGCGFVGCGDYAEAVVIKGVAVNLCPVGGEAVAKKVAEILGIELKESYPYRPAVHCQAKREDKLGKHDYVGERSCTAANLVAGVQGCAYGCLGMGDCVNACKFDAIHVIDGQTVVDYEKCVGCGACEKACPRHVISMVPFKSDRMYILRCNNKDFGKDVKSVCNVGCIGCGACARQAANIIKMSGKLPQFDYDSYDPETIHDIMKTVIDKCPVGGFVQVGKPSKQDLNKVRDEKLPDVVIGKFETTVDKTEWRG